MLYEVITGIWVLREYIPVFAAMGVGGYVSVKASSTSPYFSCGALNYNSSKTGLTNYGGFISNASSCSTAWTVKHVITSYSIHYTKLYDY